MYQTQLHSSTGGILTAQIQKNPDDGNYGTKNITNSQEENDLLQSQNAANPPINTQQTFPNIATL